jgi:hypothetical protein
MDGIVVMCRFCGSKSNPQFLVKFQQGKMIVVSKNHHVWDKHLLWLPQLVEHIKLSTLQIHNLCLYVSINAVRNADLDNLISQLLLSPKGAIHHLSIRLSGNCYDFHRTILMFCPVADHIKVGFSFLVSGFAKDSTLNLQSVVKFFNSAALAARNMKIVSLDLRCTPLLVSADDTART